MKYFRDKKEGTYRSGEEGEEPLRDPGLSYV